MSFLILFLMFYVLGAQKLYFMRYFRAVIILFNLGLYKSAFFDSFGKLVFCLSMFCFFSISATCSMILFLLYKVICRHMIIAL